MGMPRWRVTGARRSLSLLSSCCGCCWGPRRNEDDALCSRAAAFQQRAIGVVWSPIDALSVPARSRTPSHTQPEPRATPEVEVGEGGAATFPHRVRAALRSVLDERGISAAELSLSFRVIMRANLYVGKKIQTPQTNSVEEALGQWSRLTAAKSLGWPALREAWIEAMASDRRHTYRSRARPADVRACRNPALDTASSVAVAVRVDGGRGMGPESQEGRGAQSLTGSGLTRFGLGRISLPPLGSMWRSRSSRSWPSPARLETKIENSAPARQMAPAALMRFQVQAVREAQLSGATVRTARRAQRTVDQDRLWCVSPVAPSLDQVRFAKPYAKGMMRSPHDHFGSSSGGSREGAPVSIVLFAVATLATGDQHPSVRSPPRRRDAASQSKGQRGWPGVAHAFVFLEYVHAAARAPTHSQIRCF